MILGQMFSNISEVTTFFHEASNGLQKQLLKKLTISFQIIENRKTYFTLTIHKKP